MKTRLFCLICAIFLVACGNPEQASVPSRSQTVAGGTPASAQQKNEAAPAKIKGLYIGMDILDVPNAMMEILADRQLSDFSFTDPIQVGDGTQCVLMYTKPFLRAIQARMRERYGEAKAQAKIDEEILTSCVNSDGVLIAKSDNRGRVNRIEFNDTKDIFDTAAIPPSEFAKKLSGEYHIPDMQPNEAKTSWSYVGADGAKIMVDGREVLGIPMLRLYMSRQEP